MSQLTRREAEVIWLARPLGWLVVLIGQLYFWGCVYLMYQNHWRWFQGEGALIAFAIFGLMASFYMPWVHHKAKKVLFPK
jgi:hypothetical protein